MEFAEIEAPETESEEKRKDKIKNKDNSQTYNQKEDRNKQTKDEVNTNSKKEKDNKIKDEKRDEDTENSNIKKEEKIMDKLKCPIIIIISIIVAIVAIFVGFIPKNRLQTEEPPKNKTQNNITLIDNNIEKNVGVVQLIKEEPGDKISIRKELLKTVKNFIACVGAPGSGKSTFASNYYKYLYHVKNDYFESSISELTYTKGIWMVSEQERRRIPEYINNDILDVEGFEVDEKKSFEYIMVIAFLSTDLIILNKEGRLINVNKILNITQNYLLKMIELNLPIILKNIYIQTTRKSFKPMEELLEMFKINRTIFGEINFEYIYLPNIPGEPKELMEIEEYRFYFEKIINKLNNTNDYNSVSSLREYIDDFNKAIKLDKLFKNQNIFKDIKNEFEGVYNKVYKSVREELSQKESDLIRPNLNETFEEFISKQTNLNFEFDIKNSNFTLYGNPSYNNYFEELKKNKSFRIEPKDVFLDFYNNEKLQLEYKESVKKQFINLYIQKKREINSYFNSLEFYQEIEDMDLEIKIEIDLDLKNEKENDLKYYFNNKTSEKKKEWEDQIQRAKWKMPVQATGSDRCPNGHKFRSDNVFCRKCKENFYWVDGNTDYVICKGCGTVIKIKEPLYCSRCGVELPDKLKRIPGYKP